MSGFNFGGFGDSGFGSPFKSSFSSNGIGSGYSLGNFGGNTFDNFGKSDFGSNIFSNSGGSGMFGSSGSSSIFENSGSSGIFGNSGGSYYSNSYSAPFSSKSTANSFQDSLGMKYIQMNEGYRDQVYQIKLKSGQLDAPTVGYGHKLPANTPIGTKFSKEDLETQFQKDYDIAKKGARQFVNNWDSLSQNQKEVLIDMNFQMGNAGVSKFKKLKAAIEDYDFDTAAKEIMNSKYAKQTNSRAKANAKKIKN